ncbi:tRNA (adenosine(37)-N6)-threonylcarbamoyltransferase complex dimerization subunit type 1 TsaB [Devosia sp. J2-20]|jgi:tRNA threonylcarbamoyladenosine biosynthesis protein TsaB|uniref:tRNA (adenosine(37)-N6)-threonylcarbamoyltransferase complex dimerization subunit type 1 TsaB n=1 Tax=Devosia TaxID=46913 RepID=UPI0022B03483|nr:MULTISPECIES: tRNA (adenosine(37)-N6)-threonylcarbamoyltransferase complex dimerization subunit type 1 TsaB [Devosia]MCZ4347890.1 tRNA (adenosine(37)-N6)-threonylcarbamoyltransferase complex dimerization subunit type 1 TsaB [Devosia neptuniae]WDR00373.1 tRNA (adenosine(37)-N6)-threonylcarbamoyltransferase complex dimerization subunit type 1 TsaB [Devosia sp. J2-20]|tara:strand:- start:18596 stop:19210 length:615 start_codon:yes stop_codon:yes gene_type:complete
MSPTHGIVLAIDTAAPRLQLALLLADGSVDVSVDEMATGQAEAIFGRIAQLLGRNGVGYADLSRVVTTTGPGSFTGLRIGLSAARGIGLARTIPVIGVPSLLALSLSVAGPSTVLLDARRGEAYFQIFAGAGVALTPPDLVAMVLAQAAIPPDTTLISSPFVDIGLLAQYGAQADPATHMPEASYVRDADAKPQTAGRVERLNV